MKKSIALIICIVIVLLTFCSCASSSNYTYEPEPVPVTRYSITLHAKCVSNLLFSKYDIAIYVDNNKCDTLSHGSESDFLYNLTKGSHTITFQSADNASVKGQIVLDDIQSDIDLSVKLYCEKKEISVTTVYVDRKIELSEDEIKIEDSDLHFYGNDYKDVVKYFSDLGFTNIRTEPVYDIVFGILASENDFDSVSIAGDTEIQKGDIFKKTDEVVIKYHLYEEKATDSQTESSSDENVDSSVEAETSTETDTTQTDETAMTVEGTQVVKATEPSILTIDNCEAFANLFSSESDYTDYKAFSKKYSGKTIAFNGRIDYCVNHDNYDTRYDILTSYGDYNPDTQIGPTFKFNNVNARSLDLDTLFLEEEIYTGRNVYIIASVSSFNEDTGIFLLDPIKVTGR